MMNKYVYFAIFPIFTSHKQYFQAFVKQFQSKAIITKLKISVTITAKLLIGI